MSGWLTWQDVDHGSWESFCNTEHLKNGLSFSKPHGPNVLTVFWAMASAKAKWLQDYKRHSTNLQRSSKERNWQFSSRAQQKLYHQTMFYTVRQGNFWGKLQIIFYLWSWIRSWMDSIILTLIQHTYFCYNGWGFRCFRIIMKNIQHFGHSSLVTCTLLVRKVRVNTPTLSNLGCI